MLTPRKETPVRQISITEAHGILRREGLRVKDMPCTSRWGGLTYHRARLPVGSLLRISGDHTDTVDYWLTGRKVEI